MENEDKCTSLELKVHATFSFNKKEDRLEINEIVITPQRSSERSEAEAKLIGAAKFDDSWNDYRDGGTRWMEPMWLYGYWVVKARSRHTDSSAVLHHLLRGNDFKAVLKCHMTWAIGYVQKTYPGRAVPPLPIDTNEKKQEVHSAVEDGGSMDTAEEPSNAPSTVRTAGTSSGNSGQPPDTTLDTQALIPRNSGLVPTSNSPYDSDCSAVCTMIVVVDQLLYVPLL
jgi:hypothetical protein